MSLPVSPGGSAPIHGRAVEVVTDEAASWFDSLPDPPEDFGRAVVSALHDEGLLALDPKEET